MRVRFARVEDLREEDLRNETTLKHRSGDSMFHYPWVRHTRGWASTEGTLAYINPGDKAFGKRIVRVLNNDFDTMSPYLRYGECPLEAILPASFEPNHLPIPAYPVHQVLSNWWALGIRLSLPADGGFKIESHSSGEINRALWTMVTGTLAAFDEDRVEACKMWIASYWAAPEEVRHRWIAQDAPQRS